MSFPPAWDTLDHFRKIVSNTLILISMLKSKHYRMLRGYFDKILDNSEQVPCLDIRRPTDNKQQHPPSTMADPPYQLLASGTFRTGQVSIGDLVDGPL